MNSAKVYIRIDGDFTALILAGNKLLDTIDAYDAERKPLFSHHPDVHAFSGLLDKMPVADTHAMAPDLAARVLELEAENKRLRADFETALASAKDSHKRWTDVEEEVVKLREGLKEAIDALDGKIPDLHERMCCNGHECGCQGSTNLCFFIHNLRTALKGGEI
jgi:hypothetical protein